MPSSSELPLAKDGPFGYIDRTGALRIIIHGTDDQLWLLEDDAGWKLPSIFNDPKVN